MRQAYRQYLHSLHWEQFRKDALAYYHYKCAVCDLDYREKHLPIQVHHFHYKKFGKSVIGREHPYFDVCLLCTAHHPQGKLARESIQLWRKSYRFRKRWAKIFTMLGSKS